LPVKNAAAASTTTNPGNIAKIARLASTTNKMGNLPNPLRVKIVLSANTVLMVQTVAKMETVSALLVRIHYRTLVPV